MVCLHQDSHRGLRKEVFLSPFAASSVEITNLSMWREVKVVLRCGILIVLVSENNNGLELLRLILAAFFLLFCYMSLQLPQIEMKQMCLW